MNASKSLMVGVLLMAMVFCWVILAHAEPSVWPNQKGEICLHNEDTDGSARIAVMKTIGENYLVQGVNTDLDGQKTLFDGNAVVEGKLVRMNISGSGCDGPSGEVHGFVGTVELNLDLNSASSWVKIVAFHCEDTEGCDFSNEGAQLLTIVDCE